ncbi:hypothetical protein ACQUQP_02445 [Marinobacterium sp. YM272]|uniref:hypothetical protein n=1 Tax=Marinobacterium sp. YM272 TaxID=3421654 RepID=UPI003D7F35B5
MFKKFREIRRKNRQKAERARLMKDRSLLQTVFFQDCVVNRRSSGVRTSSPGPEVIVSLTTFDKRINDVCLTVESLFQQTMQADRVVLCICEKDFSWDTLPESLIAQTQRGLEILFCPEDLGPYTKFFYTLSKYPDALLITVDDDILYPIDMIDQLVKAYRREPDVIHCHRAHKMLRDANGNLLSYRKWPKTQRGDKAALDLFPTGVGGVLYFPGCFDDEILNKEAFKRLAPKADDVWLKAMSLKRGTKCKAVDDSRDWKLRNVAIEGSQQFTLKRQNKRSVGGNDDQIRQVFSEYQLDGLF